MGAVNSFPLLPLCSYRCSFYVIYISKKALLERYTSKYTEQVITSLISARASTDFFLSLIIMLNGSISVHDKLYHATSLIRYNNFSHFLWRKTAKLTSCYIQTAMITFLFQLPLICCFAADMEAMTKALSFFFIPDASSRKFPCNFKKTNSILLFSSLQLIDKWTKSIVKHCTYHSF